jgi:signal transduction histidine kinase
MLNAARSFPSREQKRLPLEGPREVKDLTRAFNEMTGRVQASQDSQREFVANVSHELKTPLTSIQGFAQAILDGTADTGESRQQAAAIIYNEAGRMHRMVLDLLDLARMDAGTIEFQRTAVDINALLRNIREKFIPQARSAKITLEQEGEIPHPILGDGDRLAQVFTNLVDNALKFTPPGGKVKLYASQLEDKAEVTVSDTGAGIPPEALPSIFDRFYQADQSRKGGEKHGAGLGLAIAHEIIQAHGGTISVRSEPGKGSSFIIQLPILTPETTTIVAKRKR